MLMRLVVVLMLVTFAPVAGQVPVPEIETPELHLYAFDGGNLLYWESEAEVIRAELWRYSHDESGPVWEKLKEIDGSGWAWYLDDQNLDVDTTWYALVVQKADGSVALSNPVTAGKYPHCDWLYVNVPPILRPECTMPPPWPYSFIVATVEEVLPL